MNTGQPDEFTGDYGRAQRVPRADYATNKATLDAWIITAPVWHPLWSQYFLGLITLADVPGTPPAEKDRPDVTHQIIVVALNPEYGPYGIHSVRDDALHYLRPGNIGEQFTATDDQAVELTELCAHAATEGLLPLETSDAPDRIRAIWRSAIQQSLDHHRDPHHGRMN